MNGGVQMRAHGAAEANGVQMRAHGEAEANRVHRPAQGFGGVGPETTTGGVRGFSVARNRVPARPRTS
jgi:hypothetical protein